MEDSFVGNYFQTHFLFLFLFPSTPSEWCAIYITSQLLLYCGSRCAKTLRSPTCNSLLVGLFHCCSGPQCYLVALPKAAAVSQRTWCSITTPDVTTEAPCLGKHQICLSALPNTMTGKVPPLPRTTALLMSSRQL